MLRLLAFAASLVFLPSAQAEVATLGEIKARNAVLLSAAELVALLPDARILGDDRERGADWEISR